MIDLDVMNIGINYLGVYLNEVLERILPTDSL